MADTQELVRFGTFELNLTNQELRKSGTLIKLSPQPFKLLVMLAHRSGQVVSREEIQQAIWGEETYVDFEQGMNHCIKQIRTALSDSADSPLYVETIPRRGYRFLAPVVTKTILAPGPRVVESQSGIQTRVPIPATQPGAPSAASPPPAVGTQATTLKPQPAQATVVSPQATTPAPHASVDQNTKPVPNRARLIAIGVAVAVLVVVIAAVIYWRTHRSAMLNEKATIVLADNITGEPVFDHSLKPGLARRAGANKPTPALVNQVLSGREAVVSFPSKARKAGAKLRPGQ